MRIPHKILLSIIHVQNKFNNLLEHNLIGKIILNILSKNSKSKLHKVNSIYMKNLFNSINCQINIIYYLKNMKIKYIVLIMKFKYSNSLISKYQMYSILNNLLSNHSKIMHTSINRNHIINVSQIRIHNKIQRNTVIAMKLRKKFIINLLKLLLIKIIRFST